METSGLVIGVSYFCRLSIPLQHPCDSTTGYSGLLCLHTSMIASATIQYRAPLWFGIDAGPKSV